MSAGAVVVAAGAVAVAAGAVVAAASAVGIFACAAPTPAVAGWSLAAAFSRFLLRKRPMR
jgi:hypothetical protein